MNKPISKIIIAGGTGFLGQLLAGYFQKLGYEIVMLTRSPKITGAGFRQIEWDGKTLGPWARELEGAAAVINLAGHSVDCRYTSRKRTDILNSRINPTRVIGEAIAHCDAPPPVWLNASTATIYKHNFGPAWDERGEIGATLEVQDGFSIQVAMAWEAALNDAPTPATRKVALRTAMVLGLGKNSVFPVLRRLTRLGLGGKMGSGRQYVSWIHETDFCRAIEWILTHKQFEGVVNVCAPDPVINAEMMRTLREICGVPLGLPATEWMLEIGAFIVRTETELLIKSRRVVPGRLIDSGFNFKFPHLRESFADLEAKIKSVRQ